MIGIGALVLAGGLIGCTEEEEVQCVYPSTTNPPEPGIWATGSTDELYTRLGEISVKINFGRMGVVGAKPVLLDTVTYQVISNCGDVTRRIESWDELIADAQEHTSLKTKTWSRSITSSETRSATMLIRLAHTRAQQSA
ncbi:hypothetical protein ACFVWF_23720 [Rhodococcus qingshengii]|uniref:hypothetical protein n=1 Tax=Rhodococcus qingshengii TaxID=334542 RepID=UPI0036D7F9A1